MNAELWSWLSGETVVGLWYQTTEPVITSLCETGLVASLCETTLREAPGHVIFKATGSFPPAGPGMPKHSSGTARMPGLYILAGSSPVGQCTWTLEQGRHQVREDYSLFAWLLIMLLKCQEWNFVYLLKTKKTHVQILFVNPIIYWCEQEIAPNRKYKEVCKHFQYDIKN